MRRSFEKIAGKYGGTPFDYVWLSISWAKQNGHVPQTLNRTEAGREIPFWASEVLWNLTTDNNGGWRHNWRLLLAGLRDAEGTEEAPVVHTESIAAAHRLMNARKRGLSLEDATEMVNWMAGHGLIESPQRTTRTAAATSRVTRQPAKQPRGKGQKRQPKSPPRVPTTGKVKTRGIPFTIENPCTALHEQWWFTKYDTYKSRTPLCRWGGAYNKETCLWHPFGRSHIRCRGLCHHFPHAPPSTGRVNHPYAIGGETSRALKGADEVIHRNRIPGRLLRHLLKSAKKGTWFLDLCSGYQTNREVVEHANLTYIAVDIEEFFKLGPGPNAKTARADIVADLAEIDPEELLRQIEEKYGLSPDDLAFIWFSPPAKQTPR